jgi:hypothetical protein
MGIVSVVAGKTVWLRSSFVPDEENKCQKIDISWMKDWRLLQCRIALEEDISGWKWNDRE